MTNPHELISKYLKEIDARSMPDGSPHPDDLNEAEFLAMVELLEAGEIDPPEDAPPISDREAVRIWIELAKKAGTINSVYDLIAHAMNKHERQVRNPPRSMRRLPEATVLRHSLDELLGNGIKQSAAIQIIASQYFVTKDAVYRKFHRAGFKLKK